MASSRSRALQRPRVVSRGPLRPLPEARRGAPGDQSPSGVTPSGELVALDAKLIVDDAALKPGTRIFRRRSLVETDLGAAGARRRASITSSSMATWASSPMAPGLTMATLDAIRHHGGEPANFMEIGGDAYRKATTALEIVLGNPERHDAPPSILCGAYARDGRPWSKAFFTGWKALRPRDPGQLQYPRHGRSARSCSSWTTELGI